MSVGSTAGLFVINYMSDQKGRKLSLLLSLFVGILGIACKYCNNLGTILGGYLKSVPVLVVSQFICGFSGYTLIIQCYVIPSDFCE